MILISLEVDNFKILQLEKLEFEQGVTLIRGLNESGKSTIMEAILFALFGTPLRPSRTASHRLLIENNSNRARVTLNFVVSGTEYRVSREIFDIKGKSSKANLSEVLSNAKLNPLETTWKGVNNKIVDLLSGVTYDEIISSCVVAQKELGKLIEQQPGKRAQIINVFLNLNDFNDTEKIVSERRKEITGPRGRGGILESEEKTLESLEEKLSDYREAMSKRAGLDEKLNNSVTEFEATTLEHKEARQTRDILNEYSKIKNNEKEIQGRVDSSQKQLKIYNEQLKGLQETKAKIDTDETELLELAFLSDIDLMIAEIKDISTVYEKLQGQVSGKYDQKQVAVSRIAELEQERDTQKPRPEEEFILSKKPPDMRILKILLIPMFAFLLIGFLVNLFLTIVAGAIAVYIVLQVLRSSNLKIQKANAKEKHNEYVSLGRLVSEKQAELDSIRQEISKLEKEQDDKMKKLSSLILDVPEQITSSMRSSEVIETVRQIIESFEHKCDERNKISQRIELMKKQLEGEPELVDKISQLREDISKDKEILSKLVFPELPSGLVFSEGLLTEYNKREERLNIIVTKLETQISTMNGEIEETDIILSENIDIPKQFESQELRVEAIRHELKTIDVVIDAITETSRNLRERVRPSVEAHMQRILPLITAGRYNAVQLSEKYDVSVFDPDAGEFRQKEIFSGGTEDQFLLAARISFALALLPQGKETHPEFLFLDEPLGSSDEVRREGIMNLTKTILGETFKQIFIISHVPGLEEWADQVVELDSGQLVS